MKKILAIIPARSGSKGIKNKNIVDLCGKPLIQYTIEPALLLKKEKVVNKVIVSTDNKRIANIAGKLGAEIPFLRPKELATDKTKSIDFVLHALNYFEERNTFFNFVVILQPTCPLRSYEDIKSAIDLIKKNSENSLISVFHEETTCDLIMYKKEGVFGVPLNKNHNIGKRRQEQEKIYIRNGAIYITEVNYIKKNKKIISDKPLLYTMPKNRSVNIDSLEDLEFVRWVLCK